MKYLPVWRFALAFAVIAFNASSVMAQVEITLSSMDTNTQFNSSLGTPMNAVPGSVATGNDPVSYGVTSERHSFTVNELDLAGDGTADDSVVFSYLATAIGGDLANVGNPFSYGVDGADDPADNEIDPGEALTFSDLEAVATFGGGVVGMVTVDSAVFDRFDIRFPGGGDVVEATGADGNPIVPVAEPNGGGSDPYVFSGAPLADGSGGVSSSPQTAFTVTAGESGQGGGIGFGVDSLRAVFTLTVVVDGDGQPGVGDFNDDGVVDCADIDSYIGLLGLSVIGDDQLDLVADGMITLADVDFLIENLVVTSNGVTGTRRGDLNCDGSVNVLGDAFALVANLNNPVTSYAAGDLDLSGAVDVLGDAFVLVANLGFSNDL